MYRHEAGLLAIMRRNAAKAGDPTFIISTFSSPLLWDLSMLVLAIHKSLIETRAILEKSTSVNPR